MSKRPSKTILYSTGSDVSLPNGPGTNEQQFVMSMGRLLGDKARFLMPRPSRTLPAEFPLGQCETFKRGPSLFPGRLMGVIRKTFALRRLAKAGDAELLVLRMGIMPWAELVACRSSKMPVVLKTFGPRTVEVFDEKPFWIRVLSPLNRWIIASVVERADYIDVVSQQHKDDVMRIFGAPDEKVLVIDNAVDIRRFRPLDKQSCRAELELPEGEKIVGYVGNLAAERGGTELVRAVAHLAGQGRRVTGLIVSGDQTGIDALRKLATELNVADQVLFRGPVQLDEVSKYISALDVAVSFRDDDGCSELKVRQYISCGRPVVVSARINAFVVENGIGTLVDRSDEEQIGRAVATWLDELGVEGADAVIAERLHDYAAGNLDFDAANRARLQAWGVAE